jgi:hypothetical protein
VLEIMIASGIGKMRLNVLFEQIKTHILVLAATTSLAYRLYNGQLCMPPGREFVMLYDALCKVEKERVVFHVAHPVFP